MGNFKQDYEKYFGDLNYEPLDPKPFIDRTKRRALDIQGRAPTASPRRQAVPTLDFGEPVEQQGAVSGLLKTGAGLFGEATLGAVEYGLENLSHADAAADKVQDVRESLTAWRESIYARMDDEVIDLKGREFLTLDPQRTIWKGGPGDVGRSIMYKLIEQVPMTLATLVPGGLMMRAGAKGAVAYLSASEAGLSVGFIQNEIKDGIKEMTDAELAAESPRFAQLLGELGPQEARNKYEAEATGMAPLIGGLVVGAIGYAAGRYLEPVLIPDMAPGTSLSFGSRVGRGAISEGLLQEAPQEGVEQIASNAARAAYDGDTGLLDGVAEAMVQGAAVGGPMGGGFAALAGRGPQQPAVEPDDDTTPVERDVPDDEGGEATAWDVTLPESDLFGDKVISVDSRDPNADPEQALTLDEEYGALGIDRDSQTTQMREMRQGQAALYRSIIKQVEGIPVSKRTADQKEKLKAARAYVKKFDASELERSARRENLKVRYGLPQDVAAAIAATRGPWKDGTQDARADVPQSMVGEGVYGALGLTGGQEQLNFDQPPPAEEPAGREDITGQRMLPGFADEGRAATLQPGQQPQQAWTQERAPETYERLPDSMDQPTAEPLADTNAQLAAMDRGERAGVYLTPQTLETYPRLLDQEAGATVRNFDGEGGAVVFKDQATAASYVERRDAGESMQALLGEITGAGDGKPVSAEAVTLQQLDADGNVERESLVESAGAAEDLQMEWEAELKPEVISEARVTPLLETLKGMSANQVKKAYGEYAEDMNYVDKVVDGKVVERRLVQGQKATQQRVAEYEQSTKGERRRFEILSPEETLLRRDQKIAEEQEQAAAVPQRNRLYDAEFQARQGDLFDVQPEVISQTPDIRITRTGPRVRVMDGDVVLWEKVFARAKEADAAREQLEEEIGGIEGLSIWQDKGSVRRKAKPQKRARVATQVEAKKAKGRVKRDLTEEVEPKLRKEGIVGRDFQEVTEGAENVDDIIERLLAKGMKAEPDKTRHRVAGIINPNKLTFADKQAEEQYKEAFSKALDGQLIKELKTELSGDQVREVIAKADADIKEAQATVANLRKRDLFGTERYSRKKNKYFAAARSVSKKRVRAKTKEKLKGKKYKRVEESKEASDIREILAATQEQLAQREVDIREEAYGDTEYDVGAVETSLSRLDELETQQKAKEDKRAKREEEEAMLRSGTEIDVPYDKKGEEEEEEYLSALQSQVFFDSNLSYNYIARLYKEGVYTKDDLLNMLEQALDYRVALNPKQDFTEAKKKLQKARDGQMYPSDMITEIARAAKTAENLESKQGRSRKKLLVLPRPFRGGVGTRRVSAEGLTAASYKEEGKEAKALRIKTANNLRNNIKENAAKLEKKLSKPDELSKAQPYLRVEAIETPVERGGQTVLVPLPTTEGVKQAMAIDYLNQLLAAAKILDNFTSNDPNMVTFLTAMDEAMSVAAGVEQDQLATAWFKVAQTQASVATPGGTLWSLLQKTGEGQQEVRVLTKTGEKIRREFETKEEAEKFRLEVREKDATLTGVVKPVKKANKIVGYRTVFKRQKKITERFNAAKYYAKVDLWRQNEDFNTFVWPLVQKMTAAYFSKEGIFHPTIEQGETLSWLLHMWANNPRTAKTFAEPLRAMMRNVGRMQFDKKTKRLIVKDKGDGRMELNLPPSFDKRERFQKSVKELTTRKSRQGDLFPAPQYIEPTRNMPDFNYELKLPTHDLFGNRVPVNKKSRPDVYEAEPAPNDPSQMEAPVEVKRTRYRNRRGVWRSSSIYTEEGPIDYTEGPQTEELFTEENYERNLHPDAPKDVQALQVFRKFRKIVDHSRSTKAALIDAEEKLLATLKELGIPHTFANFAGLVRITLPNGQVVTYRRAAQDLANNNITKAQAKGRMRAITKKMTTATAAQRDWLNQFGKDQWEGLPMYREDYTYAYELQNYRSRMLGTNRSQTGEAVAAMGDLLLDSRNPPNINDLLAIVDRTFNKDGGFSAETDAQRQKRGAKLSPFGIAARKLRNAGLRAIDVKVKWATLPSDVLGRYNPKTRTIELNENQLMDMRSNLDFYLDDKVVHTMLHEATHAATLHALRTSDSLRKSMDTLRQLMAAKWNAKRFAERFPWAEAKDWAAASYGMKNAEEFVSEMFSNGVFQQMASETDVSEMATLLPVAPDFQNKVKMNAFQRFKKLVRDVLGFEGDIEGSVFDMVMALSDQLFTGAGQAVGGPAVDLAIRDTWVGKAAMQGWDRLDSATGIDQRVRDGLLERGSKGKFVDKVTSMSQLAKRFAGRLQGLKEYVQAFRERNALNAHLMRGPEAISRVWTALQENDPKMALETSEVMTLSSLYSIDPTQAMGHKRNSNVKGPQMQERYRNLAARYNALSPEAKALWSDASTYYKSALERETALLLLNALRGVTKMDTATFDKKYNEANILKFRTQEAMEEEFGDTLKDIDLGTISRLADLPELNTGVYFPLSRYGEYAVEARTVVSEKVFKEKSAATKFANSYKKKDPTYQVGVHYDKDIGKWVGTVVDREFHLFESVTQAREEKARLEKEYDKVVIGQKYDRYTEAAIGSNKALSSVLVALDGNPAAQAAIKNFYLRNLADTSFRKKQITRKKVKGVHLHNQHRNFANYAKQSSYYTAQLKHGWRMAEAITEMENHLKQYEGEDALRLGMVLKSVKERDSLSQDLVQINPAIRGLLGATQFWMLTSASYHMINSSQPWMVTLPTMSARHGVRSTFAAMKVAQSKIIGTLSKEAWASKFGVKAVTSRQSAEQAFGVFDQLVDNLKGDPRADEYIAMLDKLREDHILEISPMTELREIAVGQTGVANRVLDASRIMAHLVEINNRVLTAIAAYDLELAKHGDKQKAVDYAAEMVETTQFNYSTANKPPLFQQLPWMFQFMQWSQHIYALMLTNMSQAVKGGAIEKAEARKALMGLLGTHAMVGGILGVSLQPIKMAMGLVALFFADDDDPIDAASAITGEWFDRTVSAGLAEVFGSDLAMVLSRGLPMALGTDLSTRMSLGTLYFVDIRTEDPESVVGSLAMSFGGAPMSQVMQWGQGAAKIVDGEWQRGVEQMAPKLFRDMMRSVRYAQEGLVNRAGDTVIPTRDMSPWQTALQFIGFAPESVSRFYAGQGAMKYTEGFVRSRKAELLKAYRTAESPNERMRIRKEIREFNRRYRYDPIKGSALSSTRKSKVQRERGYQRHGAALDAKKAKQYQEYGDPYR